MLYHEIQQVEKKVLTHIECDCCHKKFDVEKDIMQVQEFLNINLRGGYDSIFGDEALIKANFCQYCFKELLGKYLKIEY